jgi:hypothetical protein
VIALAASDENTGTPDFEILELTSLHQAKRSN